MIRVFISFVRAFLRILPSGAHDVIESLSQEASGKGYVGTLEEEVKVFVELLNKIENRKKSNENLIVFDIGANVGDWTAELILKLPKAQITAVEPNPYLFAKLERRFELFSNIEVRQVAIANSHATLPFYADSIESAMGSLQFRNVLHLDYQFEPIANVKVTTLDAFTQGMFKPTAIKIDVEGLELQVLEGAIETLQDLSLIQFEFGGTNIDSRVFLKDFFQLLSPQFRIYRLCPHGRVREIKKYRESYECFRFTIYYAVKN